MSAPGVNVRPDIDFKIVGQIVSAAGLLHVFPSETALGEFLAPLLRGVPGCESARICFRKLARPIGDPPGEACPQCARSLDPHAEAGAYACGLVAPGKVRSYSLETVTGFYGHLLLAVAPESGYDNYEPFIRNLGNALAILLENRSQRAALQAANENLEQRVAARTAELSQSLATAERARRATLSALEDRHEAEQDLRTSEAQLAHAMDQAQLVYWEMDTATQTFTFNDRFYALYATTAEREGGYQMPAETYAREFVPPDEQHLIPKDVARLLSGELEEFKQEHRIRRRDGELRHIVVRVTVIRDAAGRVVGTHGGNQDITARKQTEAALQESEAKYRRLFDNAPLGIFQSTAEGKAISLNPAFARMFGYDSVEEALQAIKNVGADIFADPNRREEILRLITENPNLRVFENVYRRKGGSTFIGSLNAAPIRDAAGALIRVEGIVEDITERKQAEAALRSFATYSRSLIEASLDPLVTISSAGKITDVNDASVQATGLPRASLIGTDFSDYFTEPAKAREGYERVFLEGFVRDYPLTLRHDSGRVAEVLYNAAVYRDEQGQVRGVCAAARDITERQQAEAKVRALLEQAQRDAHANAELLKEVNHRVKNNLLAILGLALAEQRHASTEEKPVARRITGNLRRRLEGLLEVHQMLSASQWAPVPVDHLARRIIESALSAVPTGCQVTLALAPSAGLVSPRQASNLALVLNELATNTIKYALAGRTTARITLATTSTETTLRLDYRDDGPGYPAAVLRQEGLSTGLGLVRDITTQTLRGRFTLGNDAGAVTVLEIMAEEVHRT